MPSPLETARDTANQRAQEMDTLHKDALNEAAAHPEHPGIKALADRIAAVGETMWSEVREMDATLGMKASPRPSKEAPAKAAKP